jgi:hypothetical protein
MKYDERGRAYTFDDRQQQARDREEARRRAQQRPAESTGGAGKFKGDGTVRREGMHREAAAAKARMDARRGKRTGESPSAAAAREYMNAYAQKQQRENIEKKLREQRRRQEEANQPPKPKKSAIPRLSGLSTKVVERTSVQLEWIKPFYTLATLKVRPKRD